MSQFARRPSISRSVDTDESEIDLYSVVEGRARPKPSTSSLQDHHDDDCMEVSALERTLRVISKRTDERNLNLNQEIPPLENRRVSTRTTTYSTRTEIQQSNSTQQRKRSNNIRNSVNNVMEQSLSSFHTVPSSQQREAYEQRHHCSFSDLEMVESIQPTHYIQQPRISILSSQEVPENKFTNIQTAINNDEMESKYSSRRSDSSRRLVPASVTFAVKTAAKNQSNSQEKANNNFDSKRTTSRQPLFSSFQRPSLKKSKQLTEDHKKTTKERGYIDSLFP